MKRVISIFLFFMLVAPGVNYAQTTKVIEKVDTKNHASQILGLN
jgi:hypothetical protein